ncbi:AraC family transcriptional regulator [Paenibacillus sp. PCH8]|uniref:AraC family transcriptional regulator n=1 Tax=Paenibacillus sp. PCH8 TaxID=2066524 RepID=UPI000CF970AE|nr:AraC family transcriptional regulator [Paenibacillus sp. PCH8]PQP81380.1 AraC family transcriptional regulator [Paenibacillus sp. PCH8]
MSDQIVEQQLELAQLIEHHSDEDGVHPTAIPSLFLIRESVVTEPIYRVNEPSFCIIVQGEKEILLAQDRFRYGPGSYIVATVDLPVSGQVIQASSEAPYLALKLEFSSNEILEVLNHSHFPARPQKNVRRAMYVSQTESSLLDAVVRLVRLLKQNTEDIPILSPLFKKEILYKILKGPHGNTLEQITIEGSHTYRIRNVIDHIMNHIEQNFRIEKLAELAHMSTASLHRHFKEVTAMSPIQFQKQLRLQEARRLLLSESTDAADVAFRVGYESPSQFSREYSRMFGFPPREDIKRLRGKTDETAPNS